MKSKTYWKYKGSINTYETDSNKIYQEFVKGEVIIKRLSYNFYLITIKSTDHTYSNIFMGNLDQLVGSFSPNDYTVFYTTPKGNLRAKFYKLESKTKTLFGDFKLFQN